MQQVVVVLDDQLPVAVIGVPGDAARDLHLAARRTLDQIVDRRRHVTEEIGERRADRGEAREHEAAIGRDARHAHQVVRPLPHQRARIALGQRHLGERSVGLVRPAVIAADEPPGIAAIVRAHHRAAMTAAVEQNVDLAIGMARDDHALAPHPRGDVVARVGNLAFVRDVKPGAAEDLRHLALENARIDIDRPMHLAVGNKPAEIFEWPEPVHRCLPAIGGRL